MIKITPMKTSLAITASLVLLTAFATAQAQEAKPKPPAPVADTAIPQQALQGAWVAQSIETHGEQAPPESAKKLRFTFKGDRLLIAGNTSPDKEEDCPYKVDATQSPKHLEFTPPKEEKPVVGIYELSGDTLKICFRHASSTGGRPTEFRTTPESQFVLVLFKKAAP